MIFMVELILEDYCDECRDMDIKTEITTLAPGHITRSGKTIDDTDDFDRNVVYICLTCSKAKRCAAQVRYLERRFKGYGNDGERIPESGNEDR